MPEDADGLLPGDDDNECDQPDEWRDVGDDPLNWPGDDD